MTNYSLDEDERGTEVVERRGKFGRPPSADKFGLLPHRVREAVNDMIIDIEDGNDWFYFATEGKTWLIAKLWEDNTHFEVIASEVRHVSGTIHV